MITIQLDTGEAEGLAELLEGEVRDVGFSALAAEIRAQLAADRAHLDRMRADMYGGTDD